MKGVSDHVKFLFVKNNGLPKNNKHIDALVINSKTSKELFSNLDAKFGNLTAHSQRILSKITKLDKMEDNQWNKIIYFVEKFTTLRNEAINCSIPDSVDNLPVFHALISKLGPRQQVTFLQGSDDLDIMPVNEKMNALLEFLNSELKKAYSLNSLNSAKFEQGGVSHKSNYTC